MRPLRSLVIFIAVVFLGGALLAPWLYWLADAFAHTFPSLAQKPFHRYVNRSMLGLALIGLWPFLRSLGIKSAADVGLVRPAGQWRKLGGGFLLGFGSLACVAVLALVAGARKFNHAFAGADWTVKLLGIVLTAGAVGVLEEILFRGALFGALRKMWNWAVALVVSSMVYAIVHFLARTQDPATVSWTSGFGQLGLMLAGFTDWRQIVPGFFNLTLAGMLLALAYQRTGNLYFSIGLHAGWIFWLKSYGWLTAEVAGAGVWFWGTRKLIDGWLALPLLAIVLAISLRVFRRAETKSRYDGICF